MGAGARGAKALLLSTLRPEVEEALRAGPGGPETELLRIELMLRRDGEGAPAAPAPAAPSAAEGSPGVDAAEAGRGTAGADAAAPTEGSPPAEAAGQALVAEAPQATHELQLPLRLGGETVGHVALAVRGPSAPPDAALLGDAAPSLQLLCDLAAPFLAAPRGLVGGAPVGDVVRQAAQAYVDEARRRHREGQTLSLALAESFVGVVLSTAVTALGSRKEAFLLFGERQTVEGRNHHRVFERALRKVLAALDALGEPVEPALRAQLDD